MRIVRIGATWGAIVGAGTAVLMISLDELMPFSVTMNGFVERATFRLCPLYILGFTSFVKSMTSLCLITVAGNALLYGIVFAAVSSVIAFGVELFRRSNG